MFTHSQLQELMNDEFKTKELKPFIEKITGKPLGFDMFRPDQAKEGVSAPDQAGKEHFIKWSCLIHFSLINKYYTDELKGKGETKTETETETKTEAKTETETKPKRKLDFTDLGKIFQDIFDQQDQQIDKAQVEQIVKSSIAPIVQKAIADIQPEILIVDKVKQTEFKAKGKVNKKIFKKVMKLAQLNKNIMIVGPAGSGKTHLASQIADAMGRSFTSLSVTAGISESHLTGWLLPIGETETGQSKFIHLDAPFLKAYQEGNAIILLDEMDACDPNVLLTINQALANGGFTVAQRYEEAEIIKGKNVTIIGACNTFGNGADHNYTGRESLDLSTLDRFHMVSMDYDRNLEKELIGKDHALIEWSETIRKRISQNKLNRLFSTRKLLDYYQLIESELFTLEECKEFYFEGWSKDEIAKVA